MPDSDRMRPPEPGARGLIALDWGTSSLRAFLLDAEGSVLAERSAEAGLQNLPAGSGAAGFEAAFDAIAGDWCASAPEVPVVACGMVGSVHGWRHAPYLRCPVALAAVVGSLTAVRTRAGRVVRIVPGVSLPAAGDRNVPSDLPDVMRGEETQLIGALASQPALARSACIVLPGTHSKWAWVDAGRLERFRTSMAGELHAVLSAHSILGRTMAAPGDEPKLPPDEAAFAQGVSVAWAARAGELVNLLFSVRARALTDSLAPQAQSDYLSGILIGSELAANLRSAAAPDAGRTVLVGSPALTARYARAFDLVGHGPVSLLGNTAPRGLWEIASLAGLVRGLVRPGAAEGVAHAA